MRVAVASTAYGDGCYLGSDGTKFPVDAGVIGVVPLELVTRTAGLEDGKTLWNANLARFEAEDGQFKIEICNTFTIDTSWEPGYDEDDDEDEEEDWDEDDYKRLYAKEYTLRQYADGRRSTGSTSAPSAGRRLTGKRSGSNAPSRLKTK